VKALLTSCKCALRAHRRALLGGSPTEPSPKDTFSEIPSSPWEHDLCNDHARSLSVIAGVCHNRVSKEILFVTGVRKEDVREREWELVRGRTALVFAPPGATISLFACIRLLGLRGSVRECTSARHADPTCDPVQPHAVNTWFTSRNMIMLTGIFGKLNGYRLSPALRPTNRFCAKIKISMPTPWQGILHCGRK
jgi:hypothetical protein